MYEIVNTGGETELGKYTVTSQGELSNCYLSMIFYRTDLFSNEGVRLRIVRSNAPSTPVYSSWVTPSTVISNFTDSNYWIGNVRFDFNRQQLNTSTTYDLYLETQNYTHDYSGIQIGSIMNFINNGTGQFSVTNNTASYNSHFVYG